jgi:hypothetical protein
MPWFYNTNLGPALRFHPSPSSSFRSCPVTAASITTADACKCCDDGIGLERQDGHLIGRDPRDMTPAELEALGHEAMTPLKVIRARCLDCCAGSAAEVRTCTAVHCPSWPYRMATSPWRKELSPEEKKRRGDHARKMRAAKTKDDISKDDNANPETRERTAGSEDESEK